MKVWHFVLIAVAAGILGNFAYDAIRGWTAD